ncbi:helix-turn-helix domain-containing protein [Agrobacterium fabrum]|uniref:ArsR/SmtB family transcription factor n=1 Tax=Agrobacterium fabrum TaxID=1176649 RepID=UPI0031406848
MARHAGVTAQTTSGHLGKLTEAELIAVEKQGRHRYYRLASPDVAHAIHALMALAASGPKRHHPIGPKDEAMRLARTCYDHIAVVSQSPLRTLWRERVISFWRMAPVLLPTKGGGSAAMSGLICTKRHAQTARFAALALIGASDGHTLPAVLPRHFSIGPLRSAGSVAQLNLALCALRAPARPGSVKHSTSRRIGAQHRLRIADFCRPRSSSFHGNQGAARRQFRQDQAECTRNEAAGKIERGPSKSSPPSIEECEHSTTLDHRCKDKDIDVRI